jgi:hypothetical protein
MNSCIFFLSEFQIFESEFRFLNFSTAEFEKNFPTGIFGIESGIRILLTMGVPEIGTKKWNSQPSQTDGLMDGLMDGEINLGWAL